MLSLEIISVETGETFYVSSPWTVKPIETGYLFLHTTKCLNVNASRSGEITYQTALDLVKRNAGGFLKSALFSDPALVEAVFDWDIEREAALLVNLIEENGFQTVYDIGCGVGRLSLFLSEKFPHIGIYAVDQATPLVRALSQKNAELNRSIVALSADVCDLSFPGTVDFAFSALNTIRYLGSRHRIKKHLRRVADSVRLGGLYAFHCGISSTPDAAYHHTWDFIYQGEICEAHWRNIGYSHLSDLITDEVLLRKKDGSVLLREYQEQVYLSYAVIKDLLRACGDLWVLDRVLAPDTHEAIDPNGSAGQLLVHFE